MAGPSTSQAAERPHPKLGYAVLPGGLSEADHARIFDLAERTKLTCGGIARRIQKHPATVRWFMYRNGLVKPSTKRGIPTDRPNAAGRKGYSPAEDRFILALREAGTDLRIIAERATAEFGHPRSRHGVEVRLIMLAAGDDCPGGA